VPNCARLRITVAEAIAAINFTQEDESNTIFENIYSHGSLHEWTK
jgi:hypothetical protein